MKKGAPKTITFPSKTKKSTFDQLISAVKLPSQAILQQTNAILQAKANAYVQNVTFSSNGTIQVSPMPQQLKPIIRLGDWVVVREDFGKVKSGMLGEVVALRASSHGIRFPGWLGGHDLGGSLPSACEKEGYYIPVKYLSIGAEAPENKKLCILCDGEDDDCKLCGSRL